MLEGAGQCAPLWTILADAVDAGGGTQDEDPAEVTALSTAQLVIVPGFRAQFGVPAEWMSIGLSPSATPILAATRSRPHGPVSGNPSLNWFIAATGKRHRMAAGSRNPAKSFMRS